MRQPRHLLLMQLLTRFHPFIFLSGRSAPAGQAGAEGQEKHSEKRWENEASAILTHQKMNYRPSLLLPLAYNGIANGERQQYNKRT